MAKRKLTGMGSNRGDVCTHGGKDWVCTRFTTQVPPHSDWSPISITDPSILPTDGRDGERGPTGPRGERGESIKGDKGDIGPVGPTGAGFRARGLWNRNSDYEPLDLVSDGNGSTYVCTEANTGRRLANARFWQMFAARGTDGKDGKNAESRYFVQRIGTGRISTLEDQVAALLAAGGGSGSVATQAIFDSNTAAGEVVYISGDGHVDLAQADDGITATAVGIAIEDVLAGETGRYVTVGPVDCETWSLVAGSIYYLDPATPGGMTTTYPDNSGEFVIILGAASKPTQLNLSIHYFLQQP